MRRSYVFAALLAVAAFGWMASGQIDRHRQPARADTAAPPAARAHPPIAVRVTRIAAATQPRSIRVSGRTEMSRQVLLRAETAGRIEAVEAEEGAQLAEGQVIVRLAREERDAALSEAKALVRQRQIEYRAAAELSKKGFRAEVKLAESKTALDSAKAMLDRIQVDIARTTVRAPFAGVLARRGVELGGYLKVGDDVGQVIDLDPLLVVAHVTEREVASVSVGMTGSATLIDGRTVEGRVRFVAPTADPNTRTFRIELEVANPGGVIRDGLTATLLLPLEPIRAHRLSPALLSLSDDGVVGIKIVLADGTVRFMPVKILKDTAEHVWVSGLPDPATVITVGHQFVKDGQKVRPVFTQVEGTS